MGRIDFINRITRLTSDAKNKLDSIIPIIKDKGVAKYLQQVYLLIYVINEVCYAKIE